MKAPCLKCEKSGCGNHHDKCEAYMKFKEENEHIKKLKSEDGNNNRLNRNKKRIPEHSPLKGRKY